MLASPDQPIQPIPPSVFDYVDYRQYLEDYFAYRRASDDKFSLRTFASKAGLPLSNSSLFSKVIAGKRNLTSDLQIKIARAIKLGSSEGQFFALLVRFNQSKSTEAREHLNRELAKFRKAKSRTMDRESEDYYASWHHAVVRAYFGINQRENNPAAIGRKLVPPITAAEVEASIKLMLGLGLITKTANGYALRDPNIAIERSRKSPVGKSRIMDMLRLAQEAFELAPAESREYSALTAYISKSGYEAIQEKIRLFREEVKAIISADTHEDRIYTLALQLFPNSRLPEWDSGLTKTSREQP